jgi:hypothetical protein
MEKRNNNIDAARRLEHETRFEFDRHVTQVTCFTKQFMQFTPSRPSRIRRCYRRP